MIVPKSSNCTRRTLFYIVGTTILTVTIVTYAVAAHSSQTPNATLRRRLPFKLTGTVGKFRGTLRRAAQHTSQIRSGAHAISGCVNTLNPVFKHIIGSARAETRQLQRMVQQETVNAISYCKTVWDPVRIRMNDFRTKLSSVQRNAFNAARNKFDNMMAQIIKYNIVPGGAPLLMIFWGALGASEKAPVQAATRALQATDATQALQNVRILQRFVQEAMNTLHKHLGFTKTDAGKPVCLADIPAKYVEEKLKTKIEKELKTAAQDVTSSEWRELMEFFPFPNACSVHNKECYDLMPMYAFGSIIRDALVHKGSQNFKATFEPIERDWVACHNETHQGVLAITDEGDQHSETQPATL